LSGRGLEQIVKTLVVRSVDGRFALAVLPGDRTLSFEKVSRAMGAEASDLASTTEATRVTGYPIGGITPIGCADPGLAVLADHSLVALGKASVNVGAGRPDIGLEIGADELLHLSSARCVDICLASTEGAFV
jgi:prolyl-tRNA editing enzyme YbaK/EbsC (Cys-tRNA(Pro) deacylase)